MFAWVLLALVVAGTACMLLNPYLWFDEAGQFFISMGMGHWSAPFTPPDGLLAVLRSNNRYLFDPFGYTLLLRLWALVSTSAAWLRTLSFLGFLGMLATGYAVLRKARVPHVPALFLTALLPSSPLLYQYAGELRPYSYEAWGALFAAWAWYDLREAPTAKRAFAVGCGTAAFLWMRYPVILDAGVAGLLLLAHGVRRGQLRDRAWQLRMIAYALPQAVSAGLIYACCIRLQPLTKQVPRYAMASTLKYNPAHLLHPWTLAHLLGVAIFFGLLATAFRRAPAVARAYAPWAAYTGVLFAIWWPLSLAGILPSDPSSRWAIALNAVAMVCLLLIFAAGFRWQSRTGQAAVVVLLSAVALYRPALQTARWVAGDPVRFPGRSYERELLAFSTAATAPIYCSAGSTPEVRYMFEWGSLLQDTGRCRYPKNFVLLNQQNEWACVNALPLGKPVLWVDDSPGKFVRNGTFAARRLAPYRHFFSLWRVR